MEKVNRMIPVQETEEKEKNKGFSLVELIVVIAIMAILVGIVGTQVLPYIEKSREAKDEQILSSLCTAGLTSFSQNAASLDSDKVYGISNFAANDSCKAGELTANTKAKDEIVTDFKALTGYTTIGEVKTAMESKKAKNIAAINIVYSATNGSIAVTAYDSAAAVLFKTITGK